MNRIRQIQSCPSDHEWQALLGDSISAEVMQEMERHLEQCLSCAERLDALMPLPPLLLEAARDAAVHSPQADIWYLRLRSALQNPEALEGDTASAASGDETRDFEWNADHAGWAGDYELVEEIGRGGMGVVFRARQVKLQREVAVKMLPGSSHRSSVAVDRLVAEARRLAQVKHPNIVQVFDVSEHDGVPFFSMELIEGQTLSKRHRERPLSPRRAAELLALVADAVHAAHGAGVIHRDLKPANILLTAGDVPKVTDFGLATTRDEAISGGRREVAGTAEYMAPEQWAGDAELISQRTDIYGLGAILYQLLTGHAPFPNDPDPSKTRYRVLYETPEPPRQRRPQIPRDLEAICLRCLQKSPEQRYDSAADVAEDLRRYLCERPVAARPLGFLRRMAYAARRQRVQIATAGLILLGAAASAIVYGVSVAKERRVAEANVQYESSLRAVMEGRAGNGIDALRTAMERLPGDQAPLRRFFEQCLDRWALLRRREIGQIQHTAQVTSANIAPDGQHILFADADGRVFVWAHASGSTRELTQPRGARRGNILSVAFDSSSTCCAAGGIDSLVHVWNVETGSLVSTFDLDGAYVASLAFLGRETLVTGTARNQNQIRIWSMGSSKATDVGAGDSSISEMISGLWSSPDGSVFVAGSNSGKSWLCDRSGRLVRELPKLEAGGLSVAFSSDSSTVAVAGSSQLLIEARTGNVRASEKFPTGRSAKSAAIAENGNLTVVLEGGPSRAIRVATPDLDAWDEIPIDSFGAIVQRAGPSVRLLTGRWTTGLQLWELPAIARQSARAGPRAAAGQFAMSRDGRRLVTMTRDSVVGLARPVVRGGHVTIWDRPSLQPIATLNALPDEAMPQAIAHSPNGNQIVIGCDSVRGSASAVLLGEPTPSGDIAVHTLGSHSSLVAAVAFSSDRHAYSGSIQKLNGVSGEIARWDVGAKTKTHGVAHPCSVTVLAVSPDGSRLAVGGTDGMVVVLPADDLDLSRAIRHPVGANIRALDFSSDGRWLACGAEGGKIAIFAADRTAFPSHIELRGDSPTIEALRFSRDSRVLLVNASQGGAGLFAWNTEVWRQISPVYSVPGFVFDFVVADDDTAYVLTTTGRLSSLPTKIGR